MGDSDKIIKRLKKEGWVNNQSQVAIGLFLTLTIKKTSPFLTPKKISLRD